VIAVFFVASAAGCSHAKSGVVEADLGGGVTETVQGDETKKAFDLNGDGKPDAYEYYKRGKDEAGKPSDKLVRKEFDLNGDGKIDFWRWYDDKEQLEKESSDEDFDGKVDVTTHYAKGERVKEDRDFDAQGVPHTWIYYEKNVVAKSRSLRTRGSAPSNTNSSALHSRARVESCESLSRDPRYSTSIGKVCRQRRPSGKSAGVRADRPKKASSSSRGKSTPAASARCSEPQKRPFISRKWKRSDSASQRYSIIATPSHCIARSFWSASSRIAG
jgi:hypothetical protein